MPRRLELRRRELGAGASPCQPASAKLRPVASVSSAAPTNHAQRARSSGPEVLTRQQLAVALMVRAEGEVLDALRAALHRPRHARRDPDRVHGADLEDLVVELD